MALQVQIHGGPQDGEYVDYVGQYLRMAVRTRVSAIGYVADDALPPVSDLAFRIDEYVLRRGWDGEMFYVRQPGLVVG